MCSTSWATWGDDRIWKAFWQALIGIVMGEGGWTVTRATSTCSTKALAQQKSVTHLLLRQLPMASSAALEQKFSEAMSSRPLFCRSFSARMRPATSGSSAARGSCPVHLVLQPSKAALAGRLSTLTLIVFNMVAKSSNWNVKNQVVLVPSNGADLSQQPTNEKVKVTKTGFPSKTSFSFRRNNFFRSSLVEKKCWKMTFKK